MTDKKLENRCNGFVSLDNCRKVCSDYDRCESYHLGEVVNKEYGLQGAVNK